MKHSVQYKNCTCVANALYKANYEIEACKQVMAHLLSQSDCWVRPMGNSSDVENLFYGFRYRGFSLKDMKPLIALCLQMTKPDSIIRLKLLLGLETNWSGHFKNDICLTLDAVLLIDPSNFKYR